MSGGSRDVPVGAFVRVAAPSRERYGIGKRTLRLPGLHEHGVWLRSAIAGTPSWGRGRRQSGAQVVYSALLVDFVETDAKSSRRWTEWWLKPEASTGLQALKFLVALPRVMKSLALARATLSRVLVLVGTCRSSSPFTLGSQPKPLAQAA
jgi:hypothetical protein